MWKEKHSTLISILLLLQFSATAQYVISGIVKDSLDKPIPGVTILLCKLNQMQIYKFTVAGKMGDFTFNVKIETDSFTLKANVLGYTKFQKNIANTTQNGTITLLAEATTLPTVTVKNLPIIIRGDTTNYTVSHFSNKADLVIGDVLAKIPGIEIDGNGRISYNGKAISNYYIDGMDLLGSRYNIANTSIPIDLVEQIQLLNKHQPLRLLDSVSKSTNVALNLKLKNKAKNRYIGKVKLGTGVSPLLWDNSLTILNFRKKSQLIASYKNNNTGESLGLELSDNISIQKQGESDAVNYKESLLSTVYRTTPKIAVRRYLFNSTHLGNINMLNVLKNKASLRFNISLLKDKISFESAVNSTYFTPVDTVTIIEKNSSLRNEKKISTTINYLLNQPNIYISNNFKSLLDFTDEDIVTFNNISVKQELKDPFYKYSNDLMIKQKWRKIIYTINSATIFSKTPQLLNIYPGQFAVSLNQNQPFSKLTQAATIFKFSTDNYFSTFFYAKNFYQETKIGFAYSSKQLNSRIEKTTTQTQSLSADSLMNDLNGHTIKLYIISNNIIKKGKKQLEINLPIEKYFATINNNRTGRSKPYQYLFFNPGISLLLPLNSMWDFQLGYANKKDIGSLTQTYNGYIINNYRTISRNDSIFPETKVNAFNTSISYKNPVNGIFFFSNATFSTNKRNLLYTQQYADGLINNTATLKPNSQRSILVFSYFNKYFIEAKTNISINYSINWLEGEQILQKQLAIISTLGNEWKITLKYSKPSWLNIENTISLIKYKNRLKSDLKHYEANFASMLQEKLRFTFFISDNVFSFINIELYHNNGSQSLTQNYFFGDAGINYKIKKLVVEATLSNLSNTKKYEAVQLNNNYRQNTQYNLRSRAILIKCYFNL